MFVKFVTDGHTVRRKWLTGCGDLASWILFMGASIFITSDWVRVPMITTFRYLYYVRRNVLCVRANIVGRKINKVWGTFCIFFAFAFIEENCLNKLSLLWKGLMSYTVRN